MGSIPVLSGTMQVKGEYSFRMKVWYPSTMSPTSGCSPAVVILHPTQVFDARDGESEYQQTCEHFASLNVICFISLETEAQFGRRTTGRAARGLATRAMMMWDRVKKEGTIRGSPFYNAVCNRLAVSGYSMGSGSALIAAGTYTDPRDGIVALGYIHGTLVDPRFIENVRVPTLIGGGTADTLNSGDTYFQSFNTTYNRNPIMTVMLTGTPHVSGPCGNMCPALQMCCRGTYWYGGHLQIVNGQFTKHTDWLIPFFLAYLFEDHNMAKVVWEENGQLDNAARMHHVTRNARVTARLPSDGDSSTADVEGKATYGSSGGVRRPPRMIELDAGAPAKTVRLFEVSAFTNVTGTPFKLVVDSVTGSSGCESVLVVEPAEDEIFVGKDEAAAAAAAAAAATTPAPEPTYYYSWGQRVEVPPVAKRIEYAWSAYVGIYGRLSVPCLPPGVGQLTCNLNVRVVSVSDGATLSNSVVRRVRVKQPTL